MIEREDQPNAVSAAVEKMRPAIKKVRDVSAGWSRMVAERALYLPRHPAETETNYRIRYTRPTFFNAFSRTVEGLTGLVFRRDPVLGEDVPAPIAGHWENLDNQGTHGDVFIRSAFEDAVEAGHVLILVDAPAVKVNTLAEEQQRKIRPYWVHIKPEQVYNFRTTQIDGQTVLQQITIKLTTAEAVGKYGDKVIDRYKTFRLVGNVVTWDLQQKTEGKDEFVSVGSGTLGNVTRIPIAVAYGKREGFMVSTPPLEDLADLNILNYQTLSDYYHAHHICCVPMLCTIGAGDDGSVEIGPNSTIRLPEDSDAKWVETSGAALGHSKDVILEQKADMATLGLNMLAREKRAAETATAKRIDKAEADSALANIARSLEDAIELALGYHAEYMRLPEGGSVAINRDYEDVTMAAQDITAISGLVAAGQLSAETMWQMLVEGEVLPDDFDPDIEKTRLESEMVPGTPLEDDELVVEVAE